ncbi:LOW QUALITY PROTEIN: calpain-1 catalytic subunit-like [Pollicipes pollicipes]|uniref:LOW QUALITY PROTEIN: calpain-1 catalytic subunit-like n=1 Tax=Pollicipes pollicipes TaxID=41117 RepID=UPI001884AAAA|nr:LOW QUALITY PROTEIN: calpain-1 catalytic subunit-like [Pollicipes pollicipes]
MEVCCCCVKDRRKTSRKRRKRPSSRRREPFARERELWMRSNGLNGGPHRPEEKRSTISRYWTIDRTISKSGSAAKGTYQHIRRSCRERGLLFEDPDFPASGQALGKKPPPHGVVWLRPHEIVDRPRFISDSSGRFDVERGELGDIWLLQAVSTLTLTPRFLDRVVPPDQSFEQDYCGLFRFRFWHFGEWVEVMVDDRLPTHRGRLLYAHSSDPAEFWSALLEKAYAKFYGSYESLHQNSTTLALQDLTGGIVQSFSLQQQETYVIYQVLNSAVPRSSLIVASIHIERDTKRHLRLRNGLVTQHAYSVTGLARVRSKLGETPLVRLRNPWGKGEWNGPWSERSWEWDSLSDRDKDLLSVRVANDGEFWMSFDDFARVFTHLDLVHIGPDDWMNESCLHSKKPWRAVLARRRWRTGHNAGGGPSCETAAQNPQFHIQIPRSSANKCHVVVSLTQEYDTLPPDDVKKKRRQLAAIGFSVYGVPHTCHRLTKEIMITNKPLDVTAYTCTRETATFFTLPPGDYIVVPQTAQPNRDAKFLFRVLTDEQSNIWEVNEDNMVFRPVSSDTIEDSIRYPDSRLILAKLVAKYPPDVDSVILLKILKTHWKGGRQTFHSDKPSLELCKSLIMLRDYSISGRISLFEIPAILLTLHYWRLAFLKYDRSHSNKTSSYNMRPILYEAGVTVSNKVLECLILRFTKSCVLTVESFLIAMVRLHLAHERYHSIDTKMKTNPISLEEMILMTIYS